MDYEEDEEEEVGEEVEAMKAVYETDCVIIRSIPPHFHLSLKPRTADVSYDQFVEIVLEVKATSKMRGLIAAQDSDQGIKPFEDSKEDDIVASRHESSLFSSSLSDLFSKKLRLSANNALYGHSVDTIASYYEEEKLSDSLEELEAQIIGNLLPDEDDLLSGVTDGNNYIICDSNGNDIDELDLFSSNGGIDLGDVENSPSIERISEFISGVRNSSIAGENPYGEHPSRTLFVRNIDSDVKDSVLKALFEQFGDIHTFDRACKHQGNAMISYYDIRAAQNAMRALHNRLFGHKKFDIHYSIPKDGPSKKGVNQGTLEVFLYDSSISKTELHHIFIRFSGFFCSRFKIIRSKPTNEGKCVISYC